MIKKAERLTIAESVLVDVATRGPFRLVKSQAGYRLALEGEGNCGNCQLRLQGACRKLYGSIQGDHRCNLHKDLQVIDLSNKEFWGQGGE